MSKSSSHASTASSSPFRVLSMVSLVVVVLIAIIAQHIHRYPRVVLMLSNVLNMMDDATEFNKNVNVYLKGPFAPVDHDSFNVSTSIISGAFPEGFGGLFLQNGPNPVKEHLDRGYHWFDGHGMIRSLRIYPSSPESKAVFSAQMIPTPNYNLCRKYNQNIFLQLGELVGLVGLAKILLLKPLMDKTFGVPPLEQGTANTAFLMHGDKLFAMHEGALPFEVQWKSDTNTFESMGYNSFDQRLDYPFTAHPKVDPVSKEVFFSGYDVDEAHPAFKYGSIDSNGKVQTYFPISGSSRAFAHDMQLTENHALIFDSSIVFDKAGLFSGTFFRFSNDKRMRIGAIPRQARNESEIRWFTLDRPLSIIHSMHAWEEEEVGGEGGREIVLLSPVGTDFNGLDPRNVSIANHFFLAEIRLNLRTGASRVEYIDPHIDIEFPNVHPAYEGRKAKYAFAGRFGFPVKTPGFHSLAKVDMLDKSYHSFIALPEGLTAGEPIVIPKRSVETVLATANEQDQSDHVYLAVMCHNFKSNDAEWLLYDGKTMSAEPVVRVKLGGERVAMGFHAKWIPQEALERHLSRGM